PGPASVPSALRSWRKWILLGVASTMPCFTPGQVRVVETGSARLVGSSEAMRSSRVIRSIAVRVTVWLWAYELWVASAFSCACEKLKIVPIVMMVSPLPASTSMVEKPRQRLRPSLARTGATVGFLAVDSVIGVTRSREPEQPWCHPKWPDRPWRNAALCTVRMTRTALGRANGATGLQSCRSCPSSRERCRCASSGTHHPDEGGLMAVTVKRITLWRADVDNQPGV